MPSKRSGQDRRWSKESPTYWHAYDDEARQQEVYRRDPPDMFHEEPKASGESASEQRPSRSFREAFSNPFQGTSNPMRVPAFIPADPRGYRLTEGFASRPNLNHRRGTDRRPNDEYEPGRTPSGCYSRGNGRWSPSLPSSRGVRNMRVEEPQASGGDRGQIPAFVQVLTTDDENSSVLRFQVNGGYISPLSQSQSGESSQQRSGQSSRSRRNGSGSQGRQSERSGGGSGSDRTQR